MNQSGCEVALVAGVDANIDPISDDGGIRFVLFALLLGMNVHAARKLVPSRFYRPPFTALNFFAGVALGLLEPH